jgi:hypothetical protein
MLLHITHFTFMWLMNVIFHNDNKQHYVVVMEVE